LLCVIVVVQLVLLYKVHAQNIFTRLVSDDDSVGAFFPFLNRLILSLPPSGRIFPKVISKEFIFMKVTADPVSSTQEKFLFPVYAEILGFALSP